MQNPYLGQQADAITNRVNDNLMSNVLPGIRDNMIANGAYGGSRQGIAEASAIGQTSRGLADSLANLYGGAWSQDRDFGLRQQGQQQNFYTAQRGQDLQDKQFGMSHKLQQQGQQQGFYTQQRGQDLQAQQQGYNQYFGALNAQLGMGQQMANLGQQQFNAPWNALNNYGSLLSQYTGLNQTQQGPSTGGGLAGAAGGAMTAAQLFQLLFPGAGGP